MANFEAEKELAHLLIFFLCVCVCVCVRITLIHTASDWLLLSWKCHNHFFFVCIGNGFVILRVRYIKILFYTF